MSKDKEKTSPGIKIEDLIDAKNNVLFEEVNAKAPIQVCMTILPVLDLDGLVYPQRQCTKSELRFVFEVSVQRRITRNAATRSLCRSAVGVVYPRNVSIENSPSCPFS